MRLSAHSVGQHKELQRRIDGVKVLVIFSDAAQVSTRAGLYMQKEPQLAHAARSARGEAASDNADKRWFPGPRAKAGPPML